MNSVPGRLLVVTACFAAAASAFADDSLRCGGKLIVTGMTQADVLQFCGTPDSTSEESLPVRSGNQVVGETRTYRWTYASYGATRVLVFDQDVLKSIK
jgi:Protein of unknown function (DUF2845)